MKLKQILKKKFARFSKWQIGLSSGLIALSALFYLLHYVLFKDSHHIFIYLVGDIAFVPIEVLLVTLILHRLLEAREKRNKMRKMNMVIGIFFSEAGTQLLKKLHDLDPESRKTAKLLLVSPKWDKKKFETAAAAYNIDNCKIEYNTKKLEELKSVLISHRAFMLRLLENPNLLEHEYFTDLLWAIFHLTEELVQRKNLKKSAKEDKEHLCIDMKRAYHVLLKEWLYYMKHLKDDYPHLFSLAVRTNPFDPDATPYLK